MSMANPSSAAAGARRRLPVPIDPGEDELARHWNLTPADLAEIANCRGADQKRRFALQLCVLRGYGRFLMTTGTHRSRSSIICHVSSNCRRCSFSTGPAANRPSVCRHSVFAAIWD